jgi:RNA polymerase sigma-70 factor (ECF subfamily)
MNNHRFNTTHWSVVLMAKGNDKDAHDALRKLCEAYYMPVFHVLERILAKDSRRVYGGRDAEDLTHDFFARFLEGETFNLAEKKSGRFRYYLLGAVKHFLSKTREKESRQKRGGGVRHTSLVDEPEDITGIDEAVFDREWAQTMLQKAFDSLGQSPETQKLMPWLICELDGKTRKKIALELGMTEIAVSVSLHRLRKRFQESTRKIIAETIESPSESEIGEELGHLIRAIRGMSEQHDFVRKL